jgi:type II secretory pathway component PulM
MTQTWQATMRRLVITRLNVTDARCEALFAPGCSGSDAPMPEALAEVISRTVRQFGIAGCVSRMAQDVGDRGGPRCR